MTQIHSKKGKSESEYQYQYFEARHQNQKLLSRNVSEKNHILSFVKKNSKFFNKIVFLNHYKLNYIRRQCPFYVKKK